jgi:hypothetical protein
MTTTVEAAAAEREASNAALIAALANTASSELLLSTWVNHADKVHPGFGAYPHSEAAPDPSDEQQLGGCEHDLA